MFRHLCSTCEEVMRRVLTVKKVCTSVFIPQESLLPEWHAVKEEVRKY